MALFKKRIPLHNIITGVAFIALVLTAYAYHDIAHQNVTREAIGLLSRADTSHLYEEIYLNKSYIERLIKGTLQEDYGAVEGNERSFRHYFDPQTNTGVAFYSYFPAWKFLGAEVTEPAGGVYPGAKEWARNSAGTSDLQNWEGALKTYGYTESSRCEAYWRLGHVLHLLADMAEPDHARVTPHAGSSYKLPDELDIILKTFVGDDATFDLLWQCVMRLPEEQKRAVVRSIYETWPSSVREQVLAAVKLAGYAFGPVPQSLESSVFQNRKYVGFERLMEEYFPVLSPAGIVKRYDFDFYFDTLADTAKDLAQEGNFEIPLGLDRQLPAIEEENPQARARYERLGQVLLSRAVEYGAGLLQLFHDIVNQPPYVRRVSIYQEGELKYQGEWADHIQRVSGVHAGGPKYSHPYDFGVVDWRSLVKRQDLGLAADKSAAIKIEFGPAAEDGLSPERIREGSVKVTIGGAEVAGRLDAAAAVWEGGFTPRIPESKETWDYTIYIEACDEHNHFPNRLTYTWGGGHRLEGNYALDSEPQTPARLRELVPPYSMEEYHPGPDGNHTIKVKKDKPSNTQWQIKELEWWLVMWNGMLELKEGTRERVERDRDWYIIDGPFYGGREKVAAEVCKMISNPRYDPDVLRSGFYGEYKGVTYNIGRLGGCGARQY